jgi:hypothetical protein
MKKVITTGRFTKVYESNGRFTKVYIGEGGGRFTKVHEANGDTLLVPQQEHRADRADRGQNDPMTLADLAHKLGVNPRTIRSWTWSRAQQAQLPHLRIPFTKLGNTLWFSPAKIDIWLQQLGNAPPALAAVKGKQKGKRG